MPIKTEYIEDDEWKILSLGQFIVGITTSTYNDDYGKFYQMKLSITNLSDSSYDFDPADIETYIIDEEDYCTNVPTYTAQEFRKRIRSKQRWEKIANVLNTIAASWSSQYYANASASLQAQANSRYLNDKLKEDIKVRDTGYLKKNTIHPYETINGYMNIKYRRGTTMNIIIPFNDVQYVFTWDITKKAINRTDL
jgi:hypothetical protein